MADYPGAITSFAALVNGVDSVLAEHHNERADEIVAIQTELGTDPAGTKTDVKTRLAQSMDGAGNLDFATGTELTIASGVIAPTQNWHNVDTQGDTASDDLDTITASGVTDGFLLFLRPNHDSRTVVIKHNTGNILCPNAADLTLDDQRDMCALIYDAVLTKWIVFASGFSVTLPSGAIVGTTDTQTLTNKRITQRAGTTTSSATPTINTDNYDFYSLTAQTADITSFTTNLSGTPTEGQKLWIAITGTAARAITWGASFEAGAVALPTTTVLTQRLDVAFIWNPVTSKWRCMASGSA